MGVFNYIPCWHLTAWYYAFLWLACITHFKYLSLHEGRDHLVYYSMYAMNLTSQIAINVS